MKAFNRELSSVKTMAKLCERLGEAHDAGRFPAQAHTTAYYRDFPAFLPASAPPQAETVAEGAEEEAGMPRKRPRLDDGAGVATSEAGVDGS